MLLMTLSIMIGFYSLHEDSQRANFPTMIALVQEFQLIFVKAIQDLLDNPYTRCCVYQLVSVKR